MEVWGSGRDCCRGGLVGERSALMVSLQFPLLILSFPQKVRIEMEIVSEDAMES